jgi:hypothetical protein
MFSDPLCKPSHYQMKLLEQQMSSPCKLVGCKERMFDCEREGMGPQKNYLTSLSAHIDFKKSKKVQDQTS